MKTWIIGVSIAGVLAAGVAVLAFSSGGMQGMDHSAMPGMSGMATSMPADAPASTKAFAEAANRMHADMATGYTGDANVDFMKGMIPHHRGAIDMAEIALDHATDPEVRALAETIIAAQTSEIVQIEAWLKARGQ